MIALGSGVIAALFGATTGPLTPIVTLIVAAIIGAIAGLLANHVVRMDIPAMVSSLTELAVIGAITVLGLVTMACGTFEFLGMITGTITFLGFTMQTYEMSVIGGGVIAAIFMLGAIAIQHAFNACLGPGEKQDRTLMLAAECGFLSMITVAIISFAFIATYAALLALVISVIGWLYTYMQYFALSKRDAAAWLDSKPIPEAGNGGEPDVLSTVLPEFDLLSTRLLGSSRQQESHSPRSSRKSRCLKGSATTLLGCSPAKGTTWHRSREGRTLSS